LYSFSSSFCFSFQSSRFLFLLNTTAQFNLWSPLQRTNPTGEGRAVAQAVSRLPLTAEAKVRARVSPCAIYGGKSGTGTDFSQSSSVFPCQYHSTLAFQSYII
jgi:hypothetical protein